MQNPAALERLLATGNAELTHTQDKGKWGKEFPKLLMEVRDELKSIYKTVSAPAAAPEVRYKDKEKRVRIEYPKTINGIPSDFLLKLTEVKFDGSNIAEQESTLGNYYTAIKNKYGQAAAEYVDIVNGEISVPEAEFLRDNLIVANDFIDMYRNSNDSEGKEMQEFAQMLLDQNERLVDTAQLSMFNINDENLDGADLSNPCKR